MKCFSESGKCLCAEQCEEVCYIAPIQAEPIKVRGVTFRDEDDAYDYFRQREIDG